MRTAAVLLQILDLLKTCVLVGVVETIERLEVVVRKKIGGGIIAHDPALVHDYGTAA